MRRSILLGVAGSIGRFEVGDEVAGFPDDTVTRQGDCRDDDQHCAFTLEDGIEYLMFDKWVARKRLVLPTGRPLPFGLRGDESVEELARVMRNLVGVEAEVTDTHEGGKLVSHAGTLGTLENPMWLYFEFDAEGQLREVIWQGPPTT